MQKVKVGEIFFIFYQLEAIDLSQKKRKNNKDPEESHITK
jgi:hypothetical protein